MSNKEANEKNEKKPFYKRKFFIFLVIIAILIVIINISTQPEQINWNDEVEMSNIIPEPSSNKAKIISNLDTYLSIYIYKMSKGDYKTYINECSEKGFTIESDKQTSSYTAYNNEGFKLYVYYSESNKKMDITLEAPDEVTNITWPSSELAQMLPVPKSLLGNIKTDTTNSFSVIVNNMTKEDFNSYIDECSSKGFNVDYDRSEKNYRALNTDGYKIHIEYIGANVIRIELNKPKEETTTETSQVSTQEETTVKNDTNTSNQSTGIRPEFKNAMDSYEEFMNEYCEFMKKYENSNNSVAMLADYTKYLTKYNEFVQDYDKWDEDEMNDEELKYYIDVQARVSKKLIDISK